MNWTDGEIELNFNEVVLFSVHVVLIHWSYNHLILEYKRNRNPAEINRQTFFINSEQSQVSRRYLDSSTKNFDEAWKKGISNRSSYNC